MESNTHELSVKPLTKKLLDQQRVDILLETQRQLLGQLQSIESTTNRTTLTVCTGLVAIPVIFFSKFNIDNFYWVICISCSIVIFIFGSISIWFIVLQRNHVNWLRRAVVRTQQALGAYEPFLFISEEMQSDTIYEHWTNDGRLFPVKAQLWGANRWLLSQLPYIIALAASALSGIAITLFSKNL